MEWWTALWHKLQAFAGRRRMDRDLDEEVAFHLAMRQQQLRRDGLAEQEAARAARRSFGNLTVLKEVTREVSQFRGLENLIQDLRYALRVIRKNRAFTIVAVLMLGAGIGLNAAIFSVFSHVLLAPLPLPDPGRVYAVSSHAVSLGDSRRASSGPDFRDYRDQNTMFSSVAAVVPHFSETWTGDGEPRVLTLAAGTPQFFTVLGIRPAMGRLFAPEEYRSLRNSTVLVSWKFWQEQLGGDAHVLGRALRIEDVSSTIVGVLPPMSDLYADVDVWDKLTTEPSWPFMDWRANKFLDVIGRLKPGVSREVAEQQLTAVLRRDDGEPRDVQVQLTPLKDIIVGPVHRQLDIIMAAVVLVLFVTCMNTAALLLARTVQRAPELALRVGLGASRGRIRQQLLIEGLLLSASGGALGIALAVGALGLVRRLAVGALPRIEGVHLDVGTLGASVVLVGLTSVLFAVSPASLIARTDLSSALQRSRTETGRAQRPFAVLIVAEIACAVILTVWAGLLVRSFLRVNAVDLGFKPARVLTAYLRTNYSGPDGYAFWREVTGRAASVPEAVSAAVSDCLPAASANGATLVFDDRPNDPQHAPATEGCWISAEYFRTIGAPLVAGRPFSDRDTDKAPPVVIINAEAARRFFPGQDAIGKRIAVNSLALGSRPHGPAPRMREIVGIVGNARQRGLDLPPEPAIYLPYQQDETYHVLMSMNLFVRSAGDRPAELGQSVRARIQTLYPNQPVQRLRVMPDVIARTIVRRTYSATLMVAFAGIALLLCAVGIYGVVSYATLQRTREFGIRMAVGATPLDVLRDVLRRGGSLVVLGGASGATLSIGAAHGLSQLLFETAPWDPAVFGSALVLLALVGVLACVLPAMRAARLDPRQALNSE
jgi:predicted permease